MDVLLNITELRLELFQYVGNPYRGKLWPLTNHLFYDMFCILRIRKTREDFLASVFEYPSLRFTIPDRTGIDLLNDLLFRMRWKSKKGAITFFYQDPEGTCFDQVTPTQAGFTLTGKTGFWIQFTSPCNGIICVNSGHFRAQDTEIPHEDDSCKSCHVKVLLDNPSEWTMYYGFSATHKDKARHKFKLIKGILTSSESFENHIRTSGRLTCWCVCRSQENALDHPPCLSNPQSVARGVSLSCMKKNNLFNTADQRILEFASIALFQQLPEERKNRWEKQNYYAATLAPRVSFQVFVESLPEDEEELMKSKKRKWKLDKERAPSTRRKKLPDEEIPDEPEWVTDLDIQRKKGDKVQRTNRITELKKAREDKRRLEEIRELDDLLSD